MKIITATTLAATLLSSGVLHAQTETNFLPVTGDDLVALIEGCDTSECFSYISGVINGIGVYTHLTENPTPFCSGPEVRSNEIRDAVVAVVKETPRLGRAAAPAAVLTAFSRNWPCTTSNAESVTSDIDTTENEDDLIKYSDLDQVDMDTLLDFISQKTSVLTLGDQNAPLEKTLHVFDDPSCEYCDAFHSEIDALTDLGWKIIIYPVTFVNEETKGYAALQYAIRDSETDAPVKLYRNVGDSSKNIENAVQIAQDAGIPMSEVMRLLATTNPYGAIDANNQAYHNLGATDDPAWILGDRISSGIMDADEILRIQQTMNIAPKSAVSEEQAEEEANNAD